MSRPITAPRLRAVPPPRKATRCPAKAIGIVGQVRDALRPESRLATLLGALLGGLVPVAAYTVAHGELDRDAGIFQVPVLIVAACLLFSATSVAQWGRLAFGNWPKAIGFVVLAECILVWSRTGWLSAAVLVYLVAINGIATGCNLSRPRSK